MPAAEPDHDVAPPARPKSRFVRVFLSIVAACTVVVILFTLGGFFARYSWRLDQMCHFRLQYFWLLAAAAVVLFVGRRRRLGLAAVAGAVVNGVLVVPIYLPADQPPASGPSVRLLSYNALGRNQRHEDVTAYLRKQDAEVVLLMEVQPHWLDAIDSLHDLYPHQQVIPRRDNFGIALLAKQPWRDVQTVDFGSAEVPTIVATLELDSQPWILIGTHPVPPGSGEAAAARNEQLSLVADYVQRQSLPVVVAGDLNVTGFSPHFHDLLRKTNLRDSRQGFGVQASWSPRLPGLAIPLDHVLVPPEFHVARRLVGPHLGSDHRPVIVYLHPANRATR